MIRLIGALIAVAGLLLISGLATASEYGFGTKVLAQDSDIGRGLYPFPAVDIKFWDIGPNTGAYDEGDVLYLTRAASGVVAANDVRITPFEYYAAGSKVSGGDKDINMPLALFPFGHAIVFLDLFGSSFPLAPIFDLRDPVYFHNTASNIITNDVRLTNVSGKAPGTKVIDFDPDHNKPVVSLQALPWLWPAAPGALIDYFDVNGNGVYDYPDDLYLIYPTGGFPLDPHVRVNSVRLYGPA
jgi:hypothetical protein